MQITLKYFGQLRHLADREEEVMNADENTTPIDVVRLAAAQYGPEFRSIVFDQSDAFHPSVMVLLNEAPIDKVDPPLLKEGDALTLLAAISGG